MTGFDAVITSRSLAINTDITGKDTPDSIDPADVGNNMIADLTALKPYMDSINAFVIGNGTSAPNDVNGVENDVYIQTNGGGSWVVWRKTPTTWAVQSTIPLGVTYQDGIISGLRTQLYLDDAYVYVTQGSWAISNVVYGKVTPTIINYNPATVGSDRIDTIYATTSNSILYLAGSPSGSPVKPTLPANTLEVDSIYVPAEGTGNPYMFSSGEGIDLSDYATIPYVDGLDAHNVKLNPSSPQDGGIDIGGNFNGKNLFLKQVTPPNPATLTDLVTTGNLNGTYTYSVTFVTADGETEASGDYAPISVVNSKVRVTIPVSSDARTISRRIYRTVANPVDVVIKKLVTTVANNTATTYDDNIADGGLGANLPRVNTTGGQIFVNNDRIGFSGKGSTSFGFNSFLLNTGYSNTAFGSNALTFNTIGFRNTGIGDYALSENTEGFNNTGIGVHALNYNTVGYDNTALGWSSMINNTTGNNNVSIGSFALGQNTTGTENLAIGSSALQNAVSSNNLAIGARTFQALTSGQSNLGIGLAVFDQNNGFFNIGIGQSAGHTSTNGWSNTLIGFQNGSAGGDFGSNNTAIGFQSGYNLSGYGNVFIGKQSGFFETGDNKLIIDNTARLSESDARAKAMVYGIFDADPANQKLNVNGALRSTINDGDPNTVVRNSDISLTSSGTYTPTITNVANTSAISAIGTAHYTRNGNEVKVTGLFSLSVTAATTASQVNISLPIASNLANLYNLLGMGQSVGGTQNGITITGETTADVASLYFMSSAVIGSGQTIIYSFTYTVI